MYLERHATLIGAEGWKSASPASRGGFMLRFGKSAALAIAAVAAVGLSAGSAAASPAAAGHASPRLVLHGTGGLRPSIHLPRDGRPAASPEGIPIQYSSNWSGYISLPKSKHATAFRFVQASYSVPSVNCTVTPTAFAYQWVGLDGDTDTTVEQDGVAGYCVSGSPTYFAWSEMYPAGVQVQFDLNPGDAVQSSVYYNSSNGTYTLALTDLTSGQAFSVNDKCAKTCKRASAEVITEGYPSAPYGGTSDFGAEHYDTIQVTDSTGQRGGLTSSNWTTDESISEDSGGHVDTEPGALYSAAVPASPALSAFEDLWFRED
jgi:hypothetical protein